MVDTIMYFVFYCYCVGRSWTQHNNTMNSIKTTTAFCCWNQPLFFSRHISAVSSCPSIEYDDSNHHTTITIPSVLADDDVRDVCGVYPSLLHKIHVLPLLEQAETYRILQIASDYAEENQSWDQQDTTRHVSYQTVDFAVEESIEMSNYLRDIQFQDRIFELLSEKYDVVVDDLSFLDLFCASYEASNKDTHRATMDRLDFHRDGSLLSFTVLLSQPENFEGGGTIFDALRDAADENDQRSILKVPGSIQPPQSGYATLHSGKLLHGGHVVTKGQRIVLVGFVDVDQRNMREGVLKNATKDWGRNDVNEFWNRRRTQMEKKGSWKVSNWKYLPKKGRSCLGKCSLPDIILKRIKNRSDPDNIRKRRLRTEDRLLRDIMLPPAERGEKVDDEIGELRELTSADIDGLMLGWEDADA